MNPHHHDVQRRGRGGRRVFDARPLRFVNRWCVLIVLSVAVACGTPEDPARREFRARLATPARLSDDELARLINEVIGALGNRVVRVREGNSTRTLDAKGRADVLAVLTGTFPVADVGLRKDGEQTLRGIGGPGTPIHSELDAAQTLWIDIDTLLPRRFDLVYSLPGMGDVAYELDMSP
jgi:hypothetical protein